MVSTIRWATLAMAGLLASGQVLADDKLDARFESVNKLLHTSSAAEQITSSGSMEAESGRAQALDHFSEARAAADAGDLERANEQLSLATRRMMEAVRLADQDDVRLDKQVRDFKSRESSINALLDAYGRVMMEAGKDEQAEALQSLVKKNLAQANELLQAGEVDQGRLLLDETYTATKMAVDEIRDGETLVRTLSFANKEEEFHYEMDRNDTHLMLVRVLLDEKLKDERINKQVKPFLEEANSLRARAEQEAERGDFDEAVVTLEESTKQVARAIRMAGIFIPG